MMENVKDLEGGKIDHVGVYGSTTKSSISDHFEKDIRLGFLNKVLSIVSVQLLVSFSSCLLFKFSKPVADFAVTDVGVGLAWLSIMGMFATMIVVACCPDNGRIYPRNYFILGVFTTFTSYIVGVATIRYKTDIVLLAMGMTMLITICLTAFAIFTKKDYFE